MRPMTEAEFAFLIGETDEVPCWHCGELDPYCQCDACFHCGAQHEEDCDCDEDEDFYL